MNPVNKQLELIQLVTFNSFSVVSWFVGVNSDESHALMTDTIDKRGGFDFLVRGVYVFISEVK